MKLYICGMGERNYKKYIPFYQLDSEVWGLGVHEIYMQKRGIDLGFNKLFEIHDISEYKQDTLKYLKKSDKRIVLKKKNKDIKNYELYPFEEIYKTYGKYFTNSLSYMLVLAYHLGYREIYLYGISFGNVINCSLRENIQERCNFYYWVGFLQANGCKIINLNKKDKCFLKTKNVYGSVVIPKILKQRKIVNKEWQKLRKKNIKFNENSKEFEKFLIELFKLGNE